MTRAPTSVASRIVVQRVADADAEERPRFSSYWEALVSAEGKELLKIDVDRSERDAQGRSVRHLALHEFLPFVECPRKLVPVIHDLPHALVIRASKSGDVVHRDTPLATPSGSANAESSP